MQILTTPSHSWEAQTINSIELIFNCLSNDTAGISEGSNYEFKLTGEVRQELASELMNGKTVDLGVDLELRAKGNWDEIGKFAREDEETSLKVKYWNDGKVHVVLSNQGVDGGKEVKLLCSDGNSKINWKQRGVGAEEVMIETRVVKRDNIAMVSEKTVANSMKIEMGDCRPQAEDKTTAICDLKLTQKNFP